jgi:Calcineurin-like phosphoesterase
VITIIGDVHGKWFEYEKLLERTSGRTIQLGDMGVGFSGRTNEMVPGSDEHRWFRGNHDNPEEANKNKWYMGDYGYLASDELFWVAGGLSIDYAWRRPGNSWWANEELSWTELDKVIELYQEKKPRFVVSHEAPESAAAWLLTYIVPNFRPEKKASTRTGQAMERMLDYHKPEKWIFGHYHIDKTFEFHGVEYTCVNELSTYQLGD